MKILFISGRVIPTPTANSIISKNIANELEAMGHRVTYIAVNQNIQPTSQEEFETHSVRSTLYGRVLAKKNERGLSSKEKFLWCLLSIVRKIQNILILPSYPDVDPIQSAEIYKLAQNLYRAEKFDVIIAVFRPFSSLSALIKLKKNIPNVVCGAYFLDLCTESQKPKVMPRGLFNTLWNRAEDRVFKKSDFILLPKSAQRRYETDQYAIHKEKIEFCEFPAFVEPHLHEERDYSCKQKGVIIVFAGTMNCFYRNPDYILRVLAEVSNSIPDISLHVYGRGNCGEILKKYENILGIHLHGMVEHKVVMNAYANATFVLNISNTYNDLVPSKIFELFASGKPIINVVKNTEDSTLKYFEKYPSVCNIEEWKEIGIQIKKVERFIVCERGKYYDPNSFYEKFEQNTPKYIAKRIVERILVVGAQNGK